MNAEVAKEILAWRKALESIKVHEGIRLMPYYCSSGRLTVGWGHNMEEDSEPICLRRGKITMQQAESFLSEDLQVAFADAEEAIKSFGELNPVRQAVLAEMAFNLGWHGLVSFEKMIGYVNDHMFPEAALEMLDSKWASQVGNRANVLAERMEQGL